MFVPLAALVFAALVIVVFDARREDAGLRHAFVVAIVVAAALVAVSTETLSLFHLLRPAGAAIVWALALAALLFVAKSAVAAAPRRVAAHLRRRIVEAPPLAIAGSAVLLLVNLALALASPPNTYDSMTYHLARVAHWTQSGSVAFFPTAILRQLYQPPLAEYAILHLHLLSGGDRFDNLVQWISYAGMAAVASLIARECGGRRTAQAYAFVLALAIPAAIVQASSTQNDVVAAFLVGAFFYFWQRAAKTGELPDFVLAGAALGLAVLCKGTSYLYCFPIGAYFVVTRFLALEKPRRRRFAASVALVLAIGAAFNLPHYARNQRVFGAPVSSGEEQVANRRLTAPIFAANAARNLALHFGTSWKPLDGGVESWLKAIFGGEIKNPESTWLDNEFGVGYSTHEDSAGNLFHLLLILAALAAAPLVLRRRDAFGLVFAILLGFVLLCALIKWQLWGSRLQLPLFVLGTALAALVAERISVRLLAPLAAIALALSATFLLHGAPRRILDEKRNLVMFEPRRKQMFRNLPDLEPYYVDACAFVTERNPAEVGLFLDYNDYEYPLWTLLKPDGFASGPALRHVGVTNVSSRLKSDAPPPEYVITMRTERKIDGADYEPVWSRDPVYVLKRK